MSVETYEVVNSTAKLELLDAASRWAEGPVYIPAGRYLLSSDVPSDRIMRWGESSGHASVFRSQSQNANGNTLDREGRLVTCEQLTRRVTRTEHDGSVTVVADRIEGKRFNSPNDVVVASDGAVFGKLTGGDVFAECPAGLFDGFRLDETGNVWTSAGNGVMCYEPGGDLIGIIRVPDAVANVCFGGPARNRLFICATGAVYAIYVLTNGIKLV